MMTAVDNVFHVLQVFFVADGPKHLLRNNFGKADDCVEWGTQFMAHIREKVTLGAVCHFCLAARADQFPLGSLDLGNVGVNRDDRAVRHSAAAYLQNPASQSEALANLRHLAEKGVQSPGNLSFRIAVAEIPAQIEQFTKPAVPYDQSPSAIKHTQTLADIFERRLKQPGVAALHLTPNESWSKSHQRFHGPAALINLRFSQSGQPKVQI